MTSDSVAHQIVVWTARVSGGFYLLAVGLWLTAGHGRRKSDSLYPWLWLAAWAVLVIHVLLAFHWVHHWEHDAAIEHTAEMTQRVIGWYWAGGLYINYAFILLWGFDAVRCVRSHSSTSGVTMQVISGFMWFNATVVFGTLWWLLPLALWMLGCGLLLRQPAELTRHSEAMKRTRVD